MKKNDIYTVKIEDMTNLGFGVARLDGKVVFVGSCVSGDTVEIKIIKLQASYAIGKIERIIEKSQMRLKEGEERCKNKGCSGCAYRLISYEEELRLKEESVRQVFKKEGLSEIKVESIIGSPRLCEYRNKAQYPIAKNKDGDYLIGFYKPKTHTVAEAADCPLAPRIFTAILEELRSFFKKHNISVYDEQGGEGLLRHVYLRRAEETGEILLTIVINGKVLPHSDELSKIISKRFPDVKGILLNKNDKNTNVILGEKFYTLWGNDYITDTLAGVRLKLTAPSFYQVNHSAAELLYAKAKEIAKITKGDTLLDLYCGVGSIGLSMAKEAGELIGIEIVESAVECASFNAKENGIENASFFTGDAAETEHLLDKAEAALGRKIKPDVIILDPPRAGCDEKLLKYVSSLNTKIIVYISCNPATLARDVRILKTLGFSATSVTPVDLFPGTGHVESVVCLTRRLDN